MEKELILIDEDDAYNALRDGLSVTLMVNGEKKKLDNFEGEKGGGFPLLRALAVYCKDITSIPEEAVMQFRDMVESSENAFLAANVEKTAETWGDNKWKKRAILGSTWDSAKSVLIGAIKEDINLGKDVNGKCLGKTALQEAIKASKKRRAASVKPVVKRAENILSVLMAMNKLLDTAPNETEANHWTDIIDHVNAIKDGAIHDE